VALASVGGAIQFTSPPARSSAHPSSVSSPASSAQISVTIGGAGTRLALLFPPGPGETNASSILGSGLPQPNLPAQIMPEPASIVLLGSELLLLGGAQREDGKGEDLEKAGGGRARGSEHPEGVRGWEARR